MVKSNVNISRVLLGGCVAAVIFYFIAGALNGAILQTDFEAWMKTSGGFTHPLPFGSAMGMWALMSLVNGIAGIWIYASIRPRYGAGPMTAVKAALVLWCVGKFAVGLDMLALGIFPNKILGGQVIGGLIEFMIGIVAGAWVYRE